MFCGRCGSELAAGARFCSACGAPVVVAAAEQPAAWQSPGQAGAQAAGQASGQATGQAYWGAPGAGYAQYSPAPASDLLTRLQRPRAQRMVAGVCAGLAQHYRWDLTWVRVLTVLITVFSSGAGLVAYIVFWLVMPEEAWMLPTTTGPTGPAAPVEPVAPPQQVL